MLVSYKDITDYIPQRHPIVMVHELMEASEEHARTQFHIAADNVFAEDGLFREPGMVENIAQTAAVQVGYIYKTKNMPIPIGYIAGIKELRISGLAPVGSTLTTEIRVLNQVLDVTLVEGKITQEGRELCRCEMRIFVRK
jgi:predicted hotdog family 3-hydroxylacyl-ACP dehydratase